MDWLLSTDWGNLSATPDLFDGETDSDELTPDTAGDKHKALAKDCARVLQDESFDSVSRLETGECFVNMENLVGMVARDRMLSDPILEFGIRCICNWLGNAYALDLFAPAVGCPSPPDTSITTFQFVLLPVHLNKIHWGIIMVSLAYQSEFPYFTPYYYESLCSDAYHDDMENIFKQTVAPFLRDWHSASMSETAPPDEESGVWINSPKHPDGTSCGVLCIAQVYDMLMNNSRLAKTVISKDDITVMRLRILWMILMQPNLTTKPNKLARMIAETYMELLATIET